MKPALDEMTFGRDSWCLLGLPFDAIDCDQALARLGDAIEQRTSCFFSTPNLNFIATARQDPELRDSVIDSELSLADGMPVVWLARLLGLPIHERVAGSTLFEALLETEPFPCRLFFFGGEADAARKACERLGGERIARCVGALNPGFGSLDEMSDEALIDQINAARADFIVVALGARKGQAWIQRNRARLDAPIVSHLGAVVNFVSGRVRRAPSWMQGLGLEWLWRITEEPALWRRYTRDGGILAWLTLSRVLPYAILLRTRYRPLARLPLAIDAGQRRDGFHIRLRGALCHHNLAEARVEFRNALESGQPIDVYLDELDYLDSAAIALLMALYKYGRRRGLRILHPSWRVRGILYFNNASFLITEDSRHGFREHRSIS